MKFSTHCAMSYFPPRKTAATTATSTTTILIILTRKRRNMLHKMAALISISVLAVICTLVFKARPVPTYPGLVQKLGISKLEFNSYNLNINDAVGSSGNPNKDKVEFSDVLPQRNKILEFTRGQSIDKGDNKKDRDDLEFVVKSSEIPIPTEISYYHHSEISDSSTEDENGENSKIIEMSADFISQNKELEKELELQKSHIPTDSMEGYTHMNVTNNDSQYSLPNRSIKFIKESNLLNRKNEERLNSAVQVIDKPIKPPKPSRNASYRNTSEVPVRRLPQAIIIGVKKSGTRALLEFLRIHPDVEGPGPEPHFFDRNYDKGLDWYRSLMPKTYEGQITIEKTPSYFITEEAPRRMLQMNPDVKLILVVRDPVTRAISDYCQAASKRRVMRPFEDMAMLDQSRGVVNTTWSAIKIGLYQKHTEKWLETFRREQIHLVDMQKLITEPAKELAKVERFFHLSPYITDSHFYLNRFKGSFPCLIRKGKVHCLDGRSKGREHPKVKKYVLNRLRRFYAPFNARFYQMVGHDFGWPVV